MKTKQWDKDIAKSIYDPDIKVNLMSGKVEGPKCSQKQK
jgi:hypothetical protein